MQQKPKDPKREAILASAARLFDTRRFDAVKLDEIAAGAGVGKGTLYLYFENKEDLFAQMAVEGMEEMAARIREISGMPIPFKQRLFLFGADFTAFLERRHGIMRMLGQVQSEPVNRTFGGYLNQMISAIHEMLQKGILEGSLRNGFTPAQLRCALVGPLLLRSRREAEAGEKIEWTALLEIFWSAVHETKNETD